MSRVSWIVSDEIVVSDGSEKKNEQRGHLGELTKKRGLRETIR